MNVNHLVIGKKIIHSVDNSEKGSDEWMKDLELKNLMLVPDYISVVGSSVGGKGGELDDIDIVVKDSVIPSGLMAIIQQLLKESTKEIHCVPDPAGPRTKYITLYDLVLVKRSGLKEMDVPVEEVVEVSEEQKGHSLSKCMRCKKAPPTVQVLWAEGMATAWFCDKCFGPWKKEHPGDIVYQKKVDGVATSHYQDKKDPKQIYRDAENYHNVPAPESPQKVQQGLGEKPETTDKYHRVPVAAEEGKHGGHRIRTITISKEKGIKSLYCGQDKVNITYLFDVNKWTMAEAQQWVGDHKSFDSSVAKAQDHFRRKSEENQSFAEMFESQGVLKNCTGSTRDHSKLFDLDKYNPKEAAKAQLKEDLRTAQGWKNAILSGKRISVRSGNDMVPLKAKVVELLIRKIKSC